MNANQLRAAISMTHALAEAIRTAREIPTGTLYAAAMNACSLSQLDALLDILKKAGLITVQGHVARWIGPEIAEARP